MRIGVIVLGADGYMGGAGLHALAQLRKRYENESVQIDLIAVVDKAFLQVGKAIPQDHIRDRLALVELDYPNTQICPTLQPGLNAASEYSAEIHIAHADGTKLFVYDASPTSAHTDNLREIAAMRFEMMYFGEKPLFFDLSDVAYFQEHPPKRFACNFIEAANPAFQATANYISANHLQLEEMWFWRAGDMGLRKVVDCGRDGVEGGSLFDKAVHDLALSVAWLGSEQLTRPTIHAASFECLQLSQLTPPKYQAIMPPAEPLFQAKLIREALDPHPVGSGVGRDQFPADAAFTLHMGWNFANPTRRVNAHYLSSWIGYLNDIPAERTFISKLEDLGIDDSMWRDEHKAHVVTNRSGASYEFDQQEARLAILECRNYKGQKLSIVCNFLGGKVGSPKAVFALAIRPGNDGTPEHEPIYISPSPGDHISAPNHRQRVISDLESILKRALDCLISNHDDSHISLHNTLLVHETLIEAQQKALANAKFRALKERSVQIFSTKVIPISSTRLKA